jgi:hypothetical protein
MKTFNIKAFDHINKLIRELSIASNINNENHAHAITKTIIDMLNALPDEGNQLEIEAANRMIKAYHYPVPTRPSTPEIANEANKENAPPTSTPPTNYPTNWNLPTLMHKVHHLRNYLMGVPPPSFPTIFKLTDDFVFLDLDKSKSSRLSYWNLVLSKFFDEGKKTDRYKNKVFKYVKAGVDNTKLFIGINDRTTTWYFAKDKQSLFNIIDGVEF